MISWICQCLNCAINMYRDGVYQNVWFQCGWCRVQGNMNFLVDSIGSNALQEVAPTPATASTIVQPKSSAPKEGLASKEIAVLEICLRSPWAPGS